VALYIASIAHSAFHGARVAFLTGAAVFGALGTGLLISAVVTYLLSKQWGLLPGQEGGAGRSGGGTGNR
jgi:hypothetical protein